MPDQTRDYRILDKDLHRVSNVEVARFHAGRPVLRLGASILFVAAIVLLTLGVFGGRPGIATLAAGMAVACYLAMSIGANDVANSLAPAYAAGAVKLGVGLFLMGAAQIAGALLAGHPVAHRIANGIVVEDLTALGDQSGQMMLAALLGASIWISFASWRNIPVSTTHAVIGGIGGAGWAAFGADSVQWHALGMITAVWMLAPLVSGLIAALLMALLRWAVADAPDRVAAARLWLPLLIATMGSLFTIYLLNLVLNLPLLVAVAAAAAFAAFGWVRTRQRLDHTIALQGLRQPALKRLLGEPLLWAAVLMAFAHGANDAGNVAGPLMVIAQSADYWEDTSAIPTVLLLMTGTGIAVGAVLFGRGLVRMVGSGITRLNPVRALCITLATAITVLIASLLGLPVSTTHIAIGGVFGVGFFREWDDRRRKGVSAPMPEEEHSRRKLVRRSHVLTILTAWLVTIPIAAGIAAVLSYLITALTH